MRLHPHTLIVGDRPTAENAHQEVAFVGTKSYRALLRWIGAMDLDLHMVTLVNAFNSDGSPRFIEHHLGLCPCVIALGNAAAKRLTKDYPGVRFFTLPHPSGLNRHNNDEIFLKRALRDCKKYVYSTVGTASGERVVAP